MGEAGPWFAGESGVLAAGQTGLPADRALSWVGRDEAGRAVLATTSGTSITLHAIAADGTDAVVAGVSAETLEDVPQSRITGTTS